MSTYSFCDSSNSEEPSGDHERLNNNGDEGTRKEEIASFAEDPVDQIQAERREYVMNAVERNRQKLLRVTVEMEKRNELATRIAQAPVDLSTRVQVLVMGQQIDAEAKSNSEDDASSAVFDERSNP